MKLIDVYPNDYPEPEAAPNATRPTDVPLPTERMAGYQHAGARRADAREVPQQLGEAGGDDARARSKTVNFDMPDVLHTFRRGHRIMVQVQSSWFPLADLNPQTFVDIPNAKASDFKKATERVYHDKAEPSGVVVGILGR